METPVLQRADNSTCGMALVLTLLSIFFIAILSWATDQLDRGKKVPRNISSSVQCTETMMQIHNSSRANWVRLRIEMTARPTHGGGDPCTYALYIERIPSGTTYQADLRQFHRKSGGMRYNAPDQFDSAFLLPEYYRGAGKEKNMFGPDIVFAIDRTPFPFL